MRGQGALEYLIIIAAVLGIAAIVVLFTSGAFSGSRESANIALCKQAAASCENRLVTGVSTSCPECEQSCINPITRRDVIGGTIECGVGCLFCKQGKFFDVTKGETTSTYNMLYGGYSPSTGHEQSGYAVSTDGIRWLKASRDPILPLGPQEFDQRSASCIHPVKIGPGQYYGYYGACCGTSQGFTWQVGFATSSNGLVWTKDNAPVLSPTIGSWDSVEATNMFVLSEGPATFKGWYLGSGPSTYGSIGYAESTDGKVWSKPMSVPVIRNNPTDVPWIALSTIPGMYQRIEYPFVINEAGTYKMWFSGGSSSGKAIGYAESSDGVSWTVRSLPVLAGTAAAWDSSGVYHPFVIRKMANYEMWYAGIGAGKIQIGYATSPDGIAWSKDNVNNPVLKTGATGDWDDTYVFCPYGLYE